MIKPLHLVYIRIHLTVVALATVMSISAQEVSDSTDIFFQHLNLQEVTVTGLTGDSRRHESSMPITVVTGKQLHATAASNIIDVVAQLPGVDQITTGNAISKPVIRGLGYNRVLIVNDGVRQEGQQWGDEHGVEIDSYDVGSVEVMRGPATLLFGSDAMAGVMIMRPIPFDAEGDMHASFSSEYQSNNGLWGLSFNIGGKQKGIGWNAHYSERHAHCYRNKIDGYVPGTQYMERSASGRLGLSRGWGNSSLLFSHYHLTPGIAEGKRDKTTGELLYGDVAPTSYTPDIPFQKIYHTKVVSDNTVRLPIGRIRAIVGYQQNRRQEYEETATEPGLSLRLGTINYDCRYIDTHIDRWEFAAGTNGMYQSSVNKGDEYLIPDYNLFDIGVFATTRWDIERWHISGGIRFDHRHLHSQQLIEDGVIRFTDFIRNFDGLAASVGAAFCLSPKLNFRFNVASGFRAPNINELASNGVHEGVQRYEVGNSNLKSEHSWQADVGLEFSSSLVAVQLSLFANRINNFIFLHRSPDNIVNDEGYDTYIYDASNARLLGLEAIVDLHPIHSVHFSNSFSYVNAQLLNQPSEDMRYVPFTPAPRLVSEIKYEIIHGSKRTFTNAFVALKLRWHLRQNNCYTADGTETPTPGYALLDFSAGTDIKLSRHCTATLSFSIDNLLDKAYQSHLSRLKYTDVNTVTHHQGVYNPGRNFSIKMSIPLCF